MLEESLLSVMYSWFTPTVLFVFLNLMIGTIAITSSFSSSSPTKPNDPNHPHIHRSPSVLYRLKSISFSSFTSPDKTQLGFPPPTAASTHDYISQEPTSSFSASESPPLPQIHETLDAKTVEGEGEEQDEPALEDVYNKLNVSHVNHIARTKSDTEPAAGAVPPKLPKKMKKSASTKSPFSHFEEEEIATVEARRPATVREGRVTVEEEDGSPSDEEVDAKADDFINRFKQQLKLQRMDSITRYKETVKKANRK